jgi:O-antigen/teichoic acid export membrane protein
MSRTLRFLGGVWLGYLYQALVTLVGFWLAPFLLRRIGQHDYGLWLVSLQILSYLMLTDFGIVALLPRETAYAIGRAGGVEDAPGLALLIGQAGRVVLYQMPFVAIASVLLWVFIPAEWRGLQPALAIILGTFAVGFPLRIFRAVLEGLQDLAFLGRIRIFSWLIGTAATIGLVLLNFGLYALAIGLAITQLGSALACLYRLHSQYPNTLPSTLPDLPRGEILSFLGRGFWISVAQVAQVLLSGTDILILGRMLGPSSVVPYSCTGKLANVLANQPQLLMDSAMPGLSEMKVADSRESIFRVSTALNLGMLMLSGAVACVFVTVNKSFVASWVGPDQYAGFTLSWLIATNMLLRHWNLTATYTIFCFGYERQISLTTLIDGAVTVGTSIVLIKFLGLIGAPLGSMLGVCLVSLPRNLSALAAETGVSIFTLAASLWPWFWRFLIPALAGSVVVKLWAPHLSVLALIAIAVSLLYVALMLPLAIRSPLWPYAAPRINGFFRTVGIAEIA